MSWIVGRMMGPCLRFGVLCFLGIKTGVKSTGRGVKSWGVRVFASCIGLLSSVFACMHAVPVRVECL